MITKILGHLNKLLDDRIRLQVGAIEYELLVSEATKASLQARLGQEVTLHTRHYLEAGAMQSAIHPRLIGFESEHELEFFDLICTVDKIGVRKALKALCRPVQEIASAIQRSDIKTLSKLPGIGATTAEKIVSTLQKKVLPFFSEVPGSSGSITDPILNELTSTLMRLGLSQYEARSRVDALVASGQRFATIEEAMIVAYRSI
ncbi:MAG TPA: helix-hairpin-helix domain-containing protein [Gemmatales bacterium]|nr:helix-hairpin-helix domain-containing protein [Gemmatales bacterium]